MDFASTQNRIGADMLPNVRWFRESDLTFEQADELDENASLRHTVVGSVDRLRGKDCVFLAEQTHDLGHVFAVARRRQASDVHP
ncbi:hypothetical protein [Sedimentitalea nanhaiensis]|uniref:hypothetical protein n=1 Tax=Sedimentitalea nanhaiensis TaxID=999627 RepID=UPI0004236708|nr:hypothetical protein [Sedimentitalea nanhaiensis]